MTTAGLGTPRSRALALGALGVVYGDIGTSPLYAMREAFAGPHSPAPTESAILGVVSAILWSLVLVVAVKYLWVVMRADDHGEGGILALRSLALAGTVRPRRVVATLGALGLFGTALLYGDGMITPAISVLSAVEGIGVATHRLEPFVVPLAVVIVIGLFAVQRQGTGRIGAVFGPVMLVWFGYLAVSGLVSLVAEPRVLVALSPTYAISYLLHGGSLAFFSLGAIFLAVTGAEALYADMGHFGKSAIARSWMVVVLPALALQYLGQGALLLRDPSRAEEIFFAMSPGWALLPLVALATLAAIIASQALISGAFSLTAQAIQLGHLPRMRVRHTSDREIGQVYVPAVNWLLMLAAIALLVGFGSSARLAAAYGIAVVLTMLITTALFAVVARDRFGWSRPATVAVIAVFAAVDLLFVAANLPKVPQGGWFPLVVGGAIYLVMSTWQTGRALLLSRTGDGRVTVDAFLRSLGERQGTRVPGTAIYLHRNVGQVPPALLVNLERNRALHQQVVLVSVEVDRAARVPRARRATVEDLGGGFVQVVLTFGFADVPDVPEALREIVHPAFGLAEADCTYVLAHEDVVPTDLPGMRLWRERMFAAMHRNAANAADQFRLPPDRVLQVGRRVEI